MKYLSVLLLIGFVGVAALGIFGVHDGMQNHDGGCALATSQGTDCPKQVNPIGYLTFHLDALRNFSTVTLDGGLFVSLALLAALAATVLYGITRGVLTAPRLSPAHCEDRSASFTSSTKRALLEWLVLHENSPSAR